METKTIIVPKDRCNEMARIGSEVDSRKNLISFMLSSNMDTTTTQFANYQKEYTEWSSKYEDGKRGIENDFVRPIIGNKRVNWNLDFYTGELVITFME